MFDVVRAVSLVLLYFLAVLSQPALAATYYVDSRGGNDANSGGSPLQALRSLGAVGRLRFQPGDDLRLKSGSVFENQVLDFTWGGSAADWATVDCYKTGSNGAALECSENDAKPEINGTFERQCAASRMCPIGSARAVPTSMDLGLLNMGGSYVSAKNLALIDSSGMPLVYYGTANRPAENFRIENIVTRHSVRRVMLVANDVRNGVIRKVHGSEYGLCAYYDYEECNTASPWSGGIVLANAPNAQVLIEENLVHDGYGEAFNCLRASHVLIRRNKAGNVHSNGYYLDQCSNTIVESNIAWGDPNEKWHANKAFGGINVSTEYYPGNYTRSAINNIVRNNLVSGFGHCLFAAQWPQSVRNGLEVGFHAYGNTCVGMKRGNVNLARSAQNLVNTVIQNNLFYSPDTMEPSCNNSTPGSPKFESNFWESEQGNSNCRGVGDRFGDPELLSALSKFDTFHSGRHPVARDFAIRETSPVLQGGRQVRSRLVVSLAEFAGQLRSVGHRCELTGTPLANDFFCFDRRETPSMGAIDRAKYPPKAPVVRSVVN